MEVKYNLDKIKSFVKDLCTVTGASMAVYDTSMRMIYLKQRENDRFCHQVLGCDEGAEKCHRSDRMLLEQCAKTGRPQSHICHAGLIDTAVPIIKDCMTVGYFIIGRVRPSKEYSDNVAERLSWCEIDADNLKDSYESLAYFTQEELDSLVNLLVNIFIDSAISIEYSDTLSAAVEYIDSNIHRRISVSDLCSKCYVSKNRLYSAFRDQLNTTIKDYIIARKIDEAKRLLTVTNKPIIEVAEMVAVGEYTYFCKLFKKRCGMSPKAFRESNKQNL